MEERKKIDLEKPWLDDVEFKELMKEKKKLYSRKVKGYLEEPDSARLVEVMRDINRMRRRLRRAHFDQIFGDLKGTWEVLEDALRGRRVRSTGGTCGYFNMDGVGVIGGQVTGGFCDFYCKVGPKLAARLGSVQDGAFLDYMRDGVEETLIWRPTTPGEVESNEDGGMVSALLT